MKNRNMTTETIATLIAVVSAVLRDEDACRATFADRPRVLQWIEKDREWGCNVCVHYGTTWCTAAYVIAPELIDERTSPGRPKPSVYRYMREVGMIYTRTASFSHRAVRLDVENL